MITERQIKTYRNTQEKFQHRAYELVKEYEQCNLGVYDKILLPMCISLVKRCLSDMKLRWSMNIP